MENKVIVSDNQIIIDCGDGRAASMAKMNFDESMKLMSFTSQVGDTKVVQDAEGIHIYEDEINIDGEVKVEEPTEEEIDDEDDISIEEIIDYYVKAIVETDGCLGCIRDRLEEFAEELYEIGYEDGCEDFDEIKDEF
jgi:hypothetical protein